MKRYLSSIVAVLCLSSTIAFADTHPSGDVTPLTADQTRELVPLKHSVQTVTDLASAGVIDEQVRLRATDRYLSLAASVAGRTVALDELMAVDDGPVKLTALQKFAGFITWVNILWFAAIVIGVLSFIYLFGDLVRVLLEIFTEIPRFVYELIFYGISGWLILTADHYRPGVAHNIALTGCLLLAGALAFTMSRGRMSQSLGFVYFALLTAAYAAVALMYTSSMIGFIAIIALMAALGFFAVVGPLCVIIGFKDDDAVGRGTLAAFLILGAFTVAHVREVSFLPVFRTGALWMGSFVGFLGLLIASSRWYGSRRFPYALMQVVTVAAGVAALFIGSVYHIPELQRIGGTFFAIWALEKFAEIPMESMRGYALLGLVGSALVYWFCMHVKNNPETFRPYLLF